MHRELQSLLRSARGEARYVVVANVDIRGFTSFFQDSIKAAVFLRGAYSRILNDYLPNVSYFKPTGDGLLLVQEVDENDEELIKAVVTTFIESALKLDNEFSSICTSIRMNWPKPRNVGIGIAWGDATRICSDDSQMTVDFSGKPLNLASRLMDLARPSGVVFGDDISPTFISPSILSRFKKEELFIRGITNQLPMDVYITPGTEIPYANRNPFGTESFNEERKILTLKQVKDRAPYFLLDLVHAPVSYDSVRLYIESPFALDDGGRDPEVINTQFYRPIDVTLAMGVHTARFDFKNLAKIFSDKGLRDDETVKMTLTYQVALGTIPAITEIVV